LEVIRNIFWMLVGRKFRHPTTAELRVDRGLCGRLRLYWYNCQCDINLLYSHASICCSPITTLLT